MQRWIIHVHTKQGNSSIRFAIYNQDSQSKVSYNWGCTVHKGFFLMYVVNENMNANVEII